MYYKKILIASTVLTLLSWTVTATPLSAETNSTTPITPTLQKIKTTEERPAKVATKTQEIREKIATKEATIKEKIQERKDMIATKAAQRWEERCDMLNKKTLEQIERYEKNRKNHIENFQQLTKRLESKIKNLKENGYNVSTLENNLVQLNTLIKKATEDYEQYIAALKKTNNLACGKSEGAYAEALKSAKMELLTARQSIIAVKEYYRTTIRQNILAARKQTSENTPRATGKATQTSPSQATIKPTATPTLKESMEE